MAPLRAPGLVAAILLWAFLLTPGAVRADGAFPDGQSLLVPPERPMQIILATTFGLVFSEDNGRTWSYGCETEPTRMGRLYVMGPGPVRRLYATTGPGAAVSSDDGCSWTIGGGALLGAYVVDVFPDPIDPHRVVALAVPETNDMPISVYLSMDGGLTYEGPIFQPTGVGLGNTTGVEIAAANNQIMYVTFSETPGRHPRLARSADGGASWTTIDLEPSLGQVVPQLAAVDRADPRKVYLRLSLRDEVNGFEALAITTDAGATWSVPVMVERGVLTAFLRREDGTVLVSASDSQGAPRGFRSNDGGATFVDWPLAVHPRGLAERGQTLFVAASDTDDGFAVGSSDDGGATWKPRLRFRDIAGVRACAKALCQSDCDLLAGLALFPPETCNPPPDGGFEAPEPGGSTGGCSCSLPGASTRSTGDPAMALLAALHVGLLATVRRRSPSVRRRLGISRLALEKGSPAPNDVDRTMGAVDDLLRDGTEHGLRESAPTVRR